jgi:hypothetical protein
VGRVSRFYFDLTLRAALSFDLTLRHSLFVDYDILYIKYSSLLPGLPKRRPGVLISAPIISCTLPADRLL